MRGKSQIGILSVILTLFVFQISFAQEAFNYNRAWRKVDSLINKKGLTQSAIAEVSKIYSAAKKEKNEPQVIKSLVYRLNLQQVTEDQSEVKHIHDIEKEITISNEPARSILSSIAAEWYWMYLQQHRYLLYNRTKTRHFVKDDITTWDIEDFHRKITDLYLRSTFSEQRLQQTRLEPFDPIIIKGNARYLRPTLFDLLAHRALNYFRNDERYLSKPAYAFEINDSTAFSDARTFSSHKFLTNDSFSLHHKAIQLYQRLISFHLNNQNRAALIDVDVDRLSFVNSYAVIENKDTLYERALQRITRTYPLERETAQAWYLLAILYVNKARQYDPLRDTSNQFGLVVARRICEGVISGKDSSEGKSNCQILLQEILRNELNMKTEKVNVPRQPFRTLISYKNVTETFFRVIKIDKTVKESLGNQWEDGYWEKVTRLPALKTFSHQLPQTNDHQTHRVEIKIDALPVGEYALLASANKEFKSANQLLSIEYFHVSNLSFLKNGTDYFVLDRHDGQPLENVAVQVWETKYDYQKRKYTSVKKEAFRTNKNGYVMIKENSTLRDRNSLQLEFTTKDDHLFLDDNIYDYQDNNEENNKMSKTEYEEKNRRIFYFTDRSIYRPGQTVYLKGILVTRNFQDKQNKVIQEFKTKLYLYDANGERVDSLTVVTNEFGSFNGKFILPANRLNGEFRVEDEGGKGQVQFSVEEYKRPKFQVEYEKQKGSYRLYDTILVSGIAKAFAGNNISNATVKYRVVRQSRFPYPWLFKSIWPTRTEQQEIAHGEIKTADDGKFVIRFAAIPDKKIRKDLRPIFDYRIVADVTDANGETRSGETVVQVGYQALQLSILLAENVMPTDSLKELVIKTTNLAGEFESSRVNLTLWRLDAPNRLIRNRYWEQPDQFVMSRDEYQRYFPYDEYSDEAKKETWRKLARSYERSDSTRADAKFAITNATFLPGWYAIEVSTIDKYGDSLKDVQFIQLIDPRTGDPGVPSYNWVQSRLQKKEPGELAITQVGSSAQNVFVIREEKRPERGIDYQFFHLSNQMKSSSLPITESDRGGIAISFVFVKHNRFYTSANNVAVPWTNKELTISYETYRDKTLPGSEEKWKMKIAGYKNEKAAAEILATMYDASLDEFRAHHLEKPSLWPLLWVQSSWQVHYSFSLVESTSKYVNEKAIQAYRKKYDQLVPGHPSFMGLSTAPRHYRLEGRAAGIDQMNAEMIMKDGAPAPTIAQSKAVLTADTSANEDAQESLPGKETSVKGDLTLIRKNFNETAFFFPDLRTDSAGNVEFSFTMPEALTRWKWMTLAHTRDLAFGYSEKSIVTQKELMLQPNLPRFLKEGDVMEISTKIVNLSDSEVTGQVQLQLIDATTNQSVDGWFQNMYSNQYFTAPAKQSVAAQFSVQVPYLFNKPVIVRLIASAGNKSDGEENVLPVLTNKVLVTESIPLNVRGSGTKEFKLDKLIQSAESETLQNHALTVEFTSNPSWYAVQALPYLMEFPYECAEQIWNRFYANALAAKIVNASPRIKEIMLKWKSTDTAALLSNLQKNQELKSVLLEETPWVLEAKSESEQKKRLALLFDLVRVTGELENNLDQLMQMQSSNGGFVWFKGGPDDRYITQYIISGIGHLKTLDAIPVKLKGKLDEVSSAGIRYLDSRIREDYERLKKSKADLKKQQLGYSAIQYLYVRSFFNKQAVPGNTFEAYNYYRKQSQQFWVQQNRYMQGMIALALFRTGDGKTAFDILRSLKQNAIVNEELGMYWKDVRSGYYWHQAPIETQSLLIEAFATIYKDNKIVDDLKTWLLKNKQTNNWNTTKATADACYALLLQGTDWLANTPVVHIKLGDKRISSTEQAEAGTGYFKKVYDGPSVTSSMGNISVSVTHQQINNSTNQPINKSTNQQLNTTWGAVYWQYFENAENIRSSATPLSLSKKVFVERNTDRGPVIEPIGDNANLKVGDKVKIRIELRVDREMEYVHMKDMRAAAFEPVNVISSYKWQGGLGYYESTKDASTNFFFSYLPKGTHVFEYTLFATQVGTFSNGITTIQCMYAPEFSAHSEGIKVSVEGQ